MAPTSNVSTTVVATGFTFNPTLAPAYKPRKTLAERLDALRAAEDNRDEFISEGRELADSVETDDVLALALYAINFGAFLTVKTEHIKPLRDAIAELLGRDGKLSKLYDNLLEKP